MGKKTCARIAACKTKSSERHNQREKDLDYVRKDLSKNNRQEVGESIAHRLDRINKIYEGAVGQKMQKTAEPVLECILIIDQNTTLDQVKEFGRLCQKEFGLTPFQWYTHMDEGHYDRESGEWIPNYHAHIVFDATEQQHRMVERTKKSHGRTLKDENGKPLKVLVDAYGKTIKLDKSQLRRMQDLAAQATGLERGKPSGKVGLDAISFKIEQRSQDLEELHAEVAERQAELDELTAEVTEAAATSRDLDKRIDSQRSELGKVTDQVKKKTSERNDLDAEIKKAETRVKGLRTMVANLTNQRDSLQSSIETLSATIHDHTSKSVQLKAEIAKLQEDLDAVTAKLNDKQGKLAIAEKTLAAARQAKSDLAKLNAELSTARTSLAAVKSNTAAAERQRDTAKADAEKWQRAYNYLKPLVGEAQKTLSDAYKVNGLQAFGDFIQDTWPGMFSSLVPRDQNDFFGTPYEIFAEDDRESVNMLVNLTGMLVMGALAMAVDYADQCNGFSGGGSSDLPRKKDDEEDEAWRRRCLYAAYYKLQPAFSRRRGLRR